MHTLPPPHEKARKPIKVFFNESSVLNNLVKLLYATGRHIETIGNIVWIKFNSKFNHHNNNLKSADLKKFKIYQLS